MSVRNVTAALAWFLMMFAACSGGGGPGGTGTLPADRDAAAPGASGGAPKAAGCAADADCGPGKGCADGLCWPLAREGLTYSVIVTPPAGSDLIADQFAGVSVLEGGTLDLTVTEPVEVRGIVAFTPELDGPDGDTAPGILEPVGGLLVATADGLVPGVPFRSEASVQARQKVGEDWTFSLRLIPGLSYAVTFIPSDDPARGALAQLPTYTFSAQFSQSESGFQVLIPSKRDYLAASVVGVVTLDEAGTQPVRGARVSTVGLGMKGTTAVTDDKGVFRVVAPPGAGPLTLRVEPGKGMPPFPAREFVYASGVQELASEATPRFVVGPVPPVREVLVQVFSVEGQALAPVPQARVEADGQAGGGTVSGYSVTGGDGVARLSLLEGVYALAVLPPEGSPYAARMSTLDLSANQDTNVFHVPLSRRARVAGRVVRDDDGVPVVGAVVTLQSHRITAFEGTSLASYEVTASAVTADDGVFEMVLDPGVYAMTVIPPASTGLARFGQPEVDLSGGDAQVTVRLVGGALVRGSVLAGGTGTPVVGAQVQLVFAVQQTDGAPTFVGTVFASALQTAGTATTGPGGRFAVVVPDSPTRVDLEDGLDNGGARFGLPAVEVLPASP